VDDDTNPGGVMRVGFTGTQLGLTSPQHRAFIAWAKAAGATEFHHGCCIGADAEAEEVMTSARDLGFPKPRVIAHPPANRSKLSETSLMFADETREPADYLDRNRNIVDACEVLAACPMGEEVRRSGTWFTVRYARRQGKPVIIFWPDGTVEATPPTPLTGEGG
jgi:hypothetical protein